MMRAEVKLRRARGHRVGVMKHRLAKIADESPGMRTQRAITSSHPIAAKQVSGVSLRGNIRRIVWKSFHVAKQSRPQGEFPALGKFHAFHLQKPAMFDARGMWQCAAILKKNDKTNCHGLIES